MSNLKSKAQFAAANADFAYGTPANDAAGLRLAVSVFADRLHLRETMREDAKGAGFRIAEAGGLDALLEGEARPLGDVVLVDCPRADAATLAALARLDLRAARIGAQLVVATSVEALDDVFGVLDQSEPQILVAPNRAEWLIALGGVLARLPARRVRELSEEDRVMLIRLAEQVGQIAQRLDGLGSPLGSPFGSPLGLAPNALATGAGAEGLAASAETSAFRFSTARQEAAGEALVQAGPAQPDARLVRKVIRQRQQRGRFFEGDLFADPAWDMLLDLTAARTERKRVSVTSLCIASGVPPTTALRWIGQMIESGLFERIEDETDRRRAFITLTEKAADGMARYFAELGAQVGHCI